MSDRFEDSFARVTDRATMKRPTSRPVAKPARAAATPEARRWPRERVLRVRGPAVLGSRRGACRGDQSCDRVPTLQHVLVRRTL